MCLNGEEVERAKEVCKALYVAAGAKLSEDPEKGQKYVREAVQAHLLPRIKAMLELAKSDRKLVVPASKLDAKPLLLGVGNGVVDLRRKQLLPNEPDYFIIRYCYADFDPSAQCPSWLQFLDAVFKGDAATIDAVQVLLGYTLTGYSREEIMIFCVGFGANGKSIFGNVISAILGDYSRTAPSQLLASRRTDDHGARNDLAMLDGARLVSINELPAGMHLDEQVVKQLAGREPISARFLHKEFFTYEPRFTPWVRTNHKPIVKGDDDGIWRRLVILPFRRTFAPHEQDPHLEGKLLKERDGILTWMVEGARRYLREGRKLSPAMKKELAQYRKDSDMLGEFLDECTEVAADARVEQKALFLTWQDWCKDNGVQPNSKKSFTQRLSERGFPPKDSNGKRYYHGLRTSGGLFPHSAGSAG
jgi:putative DNA primase/helicase